MSNRNPSVEQLFAITQTGKALLQFLHGGGFVDGLEPLPLSAGQVSEQRTMVLPALTEFERAVNPNYCPFSDKKAKNFSGWTHVAALTVAWSGLNEFRIRLLKHWKLEALAGGRVSFSGPLPPVPAAWYDQARDTFDKLDRFLSEENPPTVNVVVMESSPAPKAELGEDGYFSPLDLAEKYHAPLGALRKRLERWRNANPDESGHGFVVSGERSATTPKYLYLLSSIFHLVKPSSKPSNGTFC